MNKIKRLIEQPVGEELLIYEPDSSASHLLNKEYARLYKLEGNEDLVEIANELFPDTPAEQRLGKVAKMLQQLKDKGLIEKSQLFSRRGFNKLLTTAAMVPLIMSVVAPTPASAQSQCGGTSMYPFTTLLQGAGTLMQTDMVTICLSEGTTQVLINSTSGGVTVDETLVISTSGPGSAAGNFVISSLRPLPLVPQLELSIPLRYPPTSASSSFPVLGDGPRMPTVTGVFCNGGGNGNLPATTLQVI